MHNTVNVYSEIGFEGISHSHIFTWHNQRKPGDILFLMPEDLPLYVEQTLWEGKTTKLMPKRRKRRERRKKKKELKKLRSSAPFWILEGSWERSLRVETTLMAQILFWTVVDPPSSLIK